jgi:DNA-binding LytR/AlgR family response regulator
MKSIQIGARTYVEPENITHLESDINYTLVHLNNGKQQILSYTLGKVHASLPVDFIRVNRGIVVNLHYLKKQQAGKVWLKNGHSLVVSRRRMEEVEKNIN